VWRSTRGDDGTVRLLGRADEEIAVLTGMWAAGTGDYLAAMSPNTAYLVAELMWLSESVVRKGEMPARLRTAMLTLAQTFGVP
jgi:hypothetical protein